MNDLTDFELVLIQSGIIKKLADTLYGKDYLLHNEYRKIYEKLEKEYQKRKEDEECN